MDPLLALLAGLALGCALTVAATSSRTAALRARLQVAELTEARLRAGDADLARGQQSMAALVDPLQDQLRRVEDQLHQLEVERARAAAELRAQVTTVAAGSDRLGRETRALVDALRRPQARGRWGELQLRRVVEHAGMLDRCDFTEQASFRADDGIL